MSSVCCVHSVVPGMLGSSHFVRAEVMALSDVCAAEASDRATMPAPRLH